MNTPDEIVGPVLRMTAEVLEVDAGLVTCGAHLVNDLGASSVTFLELAVRVERHFGLVFDQETLSRVQLVDDLVALVKCSDRPAALST
jgi:acyl carrier protein